MGLGSVCLSYIKKLDAYIASRYVFQALDTGGHWVGHQWDKIGNGDSKVEIE